MCLQDFHSTSFLEATVEGEEGIGLQPQTSAVQDVMEIFLCACSLNEPMTT
jgi:hypothetical protein